MDLIHIHPLLIIKCIAGLCMYTWAASTVNANIILWQTPMRGLSEEERNRLSPLFDEVVSKSPVSKKFRLHLAMEDTPNASCFAPAMVVLTEGLIKLMDDQELKGIIAHEIGHIISRDCSINLYAHSLARLNIMAYSIIRKSVSFIIHSFSVPARIFGIIPPLLFMVAWSDLHHSFRPLIVSWIFLLALPVINKGFFYCYRGVSRMQEYDQDRFAQSIGYGRALRYALIKFSKIAPKPDSLFSLLKSTHPMTHRRIKRLEELEGIP